MDAINTIATFEPDGLIYDSRMPVDLRTIQVSGGAGVLMRGTVLAFADGDPETDAITWTGAAGETAVCIVSDDVDTGETPESGTAQPVIAQAYRSGHFCRQVVNSITGTDLTAAAEQQLQDAGIYLSNAQL